MSGDRAREHILASMASKEYRDGLVEAEINTGLSYQIRAHTGGKP